MPESARKSDGVEPPSSSDRAPALSALNAMFFPFFVSFRMGQADKSDCETATLPKNVVPQAFRLTLFHISIFSISPTQ